MRGSRRRIVAFAATMALVLPLWAGGGTAQGGVPSHPTRVVIVLFDQMIPQYATSSTCRTSASSGTTARTSSNAYLGYMASETVIAHNVITSGLSSRSTWAGPTRPTATPTTCFGKGADADAHHRRPEPAPTSAR